MKTISNLFSTSPLAKMAGTYIAATVTVAILAAAASGMLGRANARDQDDEPLQSLYQKAQVAELYELQAAFHHAASYGGDIGKMMPLWAEDGSLTVGATVYQGQDELRNFFANISGPFKHNWISLSPAFKTHFNIQGNTADIYFECHYADPAVTPYVIKSDVFGSGTAKKVHGKWVLWHIVAGSAPL